MGLSGLVAAAALLLLSPLTRAASANWGPSSHPIIDCPNPLLPPFTPTVAPAIGGIITVTNGIWNTHCPGVAEQTSIGYRYQWYRATRSGKAFVIPDATEPVYLVTADDEGLDLFADVVAFTPDGETAPIRSNTVHVLAGPTIDPPQRASDSARTPSAPAGCVVAPPVIRSAPTLSGTAQVYKTLVTSNGTWFSCGSAIAGYEYQWLRNGGAISGARSQSYDAQPADQNQAVRAQVVAWNYEGPSDPADSNTVTIAPPDVQPPPPPPPAETEPDLPVTCFGALEESCTTGEIHNFGTLQRISSFGGVVYGVRAGISAPTSIPLSKNTFGIMRVSAEYGPYLVQTGFGRTRHAPVGDCGNSRADGRVHHFMEAIYIKDQSDCAWDPDPVAGSANLYTVYRKVDQTGFWQVNFNSQRVEDFHMPFDAAKMALMGGELGTKTSVADGTIAGCYGCMATPFGVIPWQWTSTAGSSGWVGLSSGETGRSNGDSRWSIPTSFAPGEAIRITHQCNPANC